MTSEKDQRFMKVALEMARRGLGRVAPNPSVGCVIVKNGVIIGRGRTADGGRPHAETLALAQAGAEAKGACAYVTLEPCAHTGQTPPCAAALIDAGVKRVVIGASDPDPRVNGRGLSMLRDSEVEVIEGVLSAECAAMNAGFFLKVKENRPLVTLKMAATLDGKIATQTGESRWITGDLARNHGHWLRSQHDAILVGAGTVAKDNPTLTTRISGLEHRPVRVVLDGELVISATSNLVTTASPENPLWVFHKPSAAGRPVFSKSGIRMFGIDPHDLRAVLAQLAQEGIPRLLVEGGGAVHASFIRMGLFDSLYLYRAASIIGSEGVSMVGSLDVHALSGRLDLKRQEIRLLGEDTLEIYNRNV